uniref:C1q domain-containing protein n=1 Tax=Daphnia galeata TaxID=27404 RepID=A0A8J2RDW0_9CRUS|nr:unnamed protein product [Daphnia galeata]
MENVFPIFLIVTICIATILGVVEGLNSNTEFKACSHRLDTINNQIEKMKISMKSENETISLKLDFITGKLENHSLIQIALNNKMPELKILISNITTRQENIEHGLNNTIEIQKKLDSNEKLLTDRSAPKFSQNDANSRRIAFFVHSNTGFNKTGSIIPYQIVELNYGNALNITSGTFNVPVKGIYHFYFTALKMKKELSGTSSLTVQLKQIGNPDKVIAESHINSNDWYGWFPVHLQATVHLELNSTVGVQLLLGTIFESSEKNHLLTSFGGFLVNPDN